AHELDRLLDLGGCEAGEGLVEQEQPRLRRQRAGDLQPLAPGSPQGAGPVQGERSQAGELEDPQRRRPGVGPARMRRKAPTMALSRIVISSNVAGTWWVRAMPSRACSSGDARVTSAPLN